MIFHHRLIAITAPETSHQAAFVCRWELRTITAGGEYTANFLSLPGEMPINRMMAVNEDTIAKMAQEAA